MDNTYKGIFLVQVQLLIDAIFDIIGYSSQLLSLERYFLRFFGAYYLIKGIISNCRKSSLLEKVFLIWIALITVQGFFQILISGYNSIEFKQFISGLFLLNVYPFLVITEQPLSFYKKLFTLAYKLALIELALQVLALLLGSGTSMYEELTMFASGIGLLMMTMFYHSPKKRKVILFIIIFNIFIMMLLIRRNKFVFFGAILFFALMLNSLGNGTSALKYKSKTQNILISLFFILVFTFLIFFNRISYFYEDMKTGMSSREGIIELFINDFNRCPRDWITGRGMFGQFEGGVLSTDVDNGLRANIENGYLQLILKGGWIWLGLLMAISLIAMYRGLFKSNNILCKGMACIILIYFIDMVGFGVPELSLKYVCVFISISGCNSKRLREYSDEKIKNQIGLI